jgi:hypothetical protein
MVKTIYTLGSGNKKRPLIYDWSLDGAVLVLQQGKTKIDRSFFSVALHQFSGRTVEGGFSQTNPAPGGFGKWVEGASNRFNSRKLTSRHGSFVAAILCQEFGVKSSLKGNSVMLTFPTSTRSAAGSVRP